MMLLSLAFLWQIKPDCDSNGYNWEEGALVGFVKILDQLCLAAKDRLRLPWDCRDAL